MKRGFNDGIGFAYVSPAMRWSWGLISLTLFVGCGEGGPPLDELPLRDALRAEPEVVAGMSQDGRLRLAARLETAGKVDTATDQIGDGAGTPGALVAVLDRVREKRLAEPLMVGAIGDGLAHPVVDRVEIGDRPTSSLPVVEGESAGTTAPLEARALEGEAGASLRALLAASGASRLSRVVGWPIGALAIGDVVYVNASWLVALAPGDRGGDGGGADGGLDGPPPAERAANGTGAPASGPIVSSVAVGTTSSVADGGAPSPAVAAAEQVSPPNLDQIAEAAGGQLVDGGAPTPTPTPTPPPPPPTIDPGFWDACGAGADACDSSSDDSCDTTTDDGSDDSCSTPPDDGGGCQVAPGGRRAHVGTMLWLLAPLGFLLGRRP